MPNSKSRLPIPGSDRAAMRDAKEIGPADPNQQVEVTIRLRPRAPHNIEEFARPLGKRAYLSRHDYEQRHGADSAAIARVEAFAREHNLAVKETSVARRTVILTGRVANMNAAFGVELKECEHSSGRRYRQRTGEVHLPAELHDIVDGVFGLDNRPQAKPHFRWRREAAGARAAAVNRSYTPLQIGHAYRFPAGDGAGECIALVELGGGFQDSDLTAYWQQLGLKQTPPVTAVSVGNANNNPTGDPNGPDGEVMLDIEVAGALAPAAKIVVYFAENTDAGFLNAITTAVHDSQNNPSVISISWGGPESSWTAQAMNSMDQAFEAAATMGVTVCVAAGDDGSTDGVGDGENHVDFPASSPNVLACGGTRLDYSGSTISSETVWNQLSANEGATGGGISDTFPLPSYQQNAGVPPSANSNHRVGRGVPDIAGDADPTTGYNIRVDGETGVIGGTSAVAPLWAALVARLNQALGKPVGFLNPLLYQISESGNFSDISSGNNGAYKAARGWDACTGLGSPIGDAIAAGLSRPS